MGRSSTAANSTSCRACRACSQWGKGAVATSSFDRRRSKFAFLHDDYTCLRYGLRTLPCSDMPDWQHCTECEDYKVLLSLMLEVVLLMLAHIVLCLRHLYLWKRLSQLNVSAYATFIRVQRPNGLLGWLQGSVFVTFRAQRFLQSGY